MQIINTLKSIASLTQSKYSYYSNDKPIKGLPVKVYRQHSRTIDSEQLSNMHDNFTLLTLPNLVAPGKKALPDLFETPPERALILTYVRLGGEYHFFAVPYLSSQLRIFGGNFVYSSDSRFKASAIAYPIPIYDRLEKST